MEINIDTDKFEPKKAQKRRANTTEDASMEVETHNGIQGKVKTKSHPKRSRTKSGCESNVDVRKVPVPAHRYTPLKENWLKIFTPVVEHLQLQIRFNLKTRNVEIRACKDTPDIANLQKAEDFVRVKFALLYCVKILRGVLFLGVCVWF